MSILNELLVIVVMIVAVVLNIACHNDRLIEESKVMTAGRRLIIMAQLTITIWLIWRVVEEPGIRLVVPAAITLLMWGLGSIMQAVDKIARRHGREISDLLNPATHYERRKHPR